MGSGIGILYELELGISQQHSPCLQINTTIGFEEYIIHVMKNVCWKLLTKNIMCQMMLQWF